MYATKETIRKWNLENAEREGKVYLPVALSTNADDIKLVDVLIGIVGNRVENVGMVEDCIKAGKQVMLFFCSYNDPKNTLPREQEDVLFVIGNFACTFFGKGKWTFFRKVKCTS